MRTATAALLSLAAVVLVGTHAFGAAGPRPLRPSADFAVSASQPLRNFGTEHSLLVRRQPASRAFVRFTLTGQRVRGERDVLWLYPLRDAKAGVEIRHASDAVWSERAVSFRTAPTFGRRSVRTGPLRARRWSAVEVTSLLPAGQRVSLALSTTAARAVEIASRESGAHAPRLAISAPAATAPSEAPALEPSVAPAPVAAPPLTAPVVAQPPFVAGQPCGRFSTAPAWQHVVWIVMENKAWSSILGAPDAPYANGLAAQCGAAVNFFGEAHPSVPNYVAMTSGDTQGVTQDSVPTLDVPSIFSQLGGDWRVLAESMPAACSRAEMSPYTPRHNPSTFYTQIALACAGQNVPLADPLDLSARFTFIVPNECSNTHSCPVASGDAWLSQLIPKIVDTPEYRSGTTALFLTWDEAEGGVNNQIATIVVAPSIRPGTQVADALNHYSMLRATEDMLGLPLLGNAALAPDLRPAFGL